MSFIDAIKSVFTQYVGFRGRARRSEFWFYYLFIAIVNAVLGGLQSATGSNAFAVITIIFGLATLLPTLAVAVRRLHDIGKKWPFLFMGLIPIAGCIILIVNWAKDSQPGDNQFGPNPKGL